MQRQHSSQATPTLGNTLNLNICSYDGPSIWITNCVNSWLRNVPRFYKMWFLRSGPTLLTATKCTLPMMQTNLTVMALMNSNRVEILLQLNISKNVIESFCKSEKWFEKWLKHIIVAKVFAHSFREQFSKMVTCRSFLIFTWVTYQQYHAVFNN